MKRTVHPLWYLALATGLTLFTFGQWDTPLANWLLPLFLLRFLRQYHSRWAIVLAWVATSVTTYVVSMGMYPLPVPFDLILVIVTGLIALLPYCADRWLHHRIPGFASTLIFPTALVTLGYFDTLTSPYGSWGNIAYTQIDVPWIAQLASLSGMWGITFLIGWTASTANWLWERQFTRRQLYRWSLVYASVMILVLLHGWIRLMFVPSETPTAQIATVVPSTKRMFGMLPGDGVVQKLLAGTTLSDNEEQIVRESFQELAAELFLQSAEAAQDGAQIILWPEAVIWTLGFDRDVLIAQGQAFAQEHQVTLGIGVATFHPGSQHNNQLVLLQPGGEIAWVYDKANLVPVVEEGIFAAGDGVIPVIATEHGNIGGVICYDLDHHDFIRQASASNVDMLLAPVGDWVGIAKIHNDMARMRAIENGITVVRATRGGYSTVIAPTGAVLALDDNADVHFDGTFVESSSPVGISVLQAEMPTQRMETLYGVIGDVFAWASVAVFAGLVVRGIMHRRQASKLVPQPDGAVPV
ncbi:MAG: nitrilase-related carbon-nitrogen hydrolase [Chloroflexota bacterium]